MKRRRWVSSAIAILVLLSPLTAPPANAAAAPYDEPVQRWVALLTGGDAVDPGDSDTAAALRRLDTAAKGHRETLVTTPGRTHLWPDLTGTDAFTTDAAMKRLVVLATAQATKGAAFHGDAALRKDVADALRWVHDNRYNPSLPEVGNWWEWEIGIPNRMTDTVAMLGEGVPAELRRDLLAAIAHFLPDPTRRTSNGVEEVGANRVDKGYITIRRGLLAEDDAVIRLGRDALSKVFPYVTTSDGFYRDGSFVQHFYVPYTGTYGAVLLRGVAAVFAVLAGSPWDIDDPNRGNVYRWIYDSFEPVVFRGHMQAHVRGRAIAREAEDDSYWARWAMTGAAMLWQAASDSDRERIGSMLAGWVKKDTYRPFYAHASIPEIVAMQKATAGARPRGDLSLHKQFAGMDRLVHNRPGYSFSVSARSSRIAAYESGGKENRRGWYTGEGMTTLYTKDLTHYSDGYWPTVDPYRLAGTTNATEASYPRTNYDANYVWHLGPDTWAGGVALDRTTGAYGMSFTAQTDPVSQRPIHLTGRKSWFAFGDVIVALGAGITSSDVAAQTTVENRKVSSSGATVTVDGRQRSAAGWNADLTGARWVHLAGTGGYLFPSGGKLRGLGESRTGRWSDIGAGNPAAPGDKVTRSYATLWFEHGGKPRDAGYAYYLLPGRSAAATKAYARQVAAGKAVKIGENTSTVQSVRSPGGVHAANFWQAGSALATMRADQPSSLVMRNSRRRLTIAASDPTQRQTSMTFEIARKGTSILSADPNVTVLSLSPTLKFRVDASGKLGAPSRLVVATRRP